MELATREVDREPQFGDLLLPEAQLAARRFQHPRAERHDEPAHLGVRDEVVGLHEAELRVLPADERFERDDTLAGDVELRLVMNHELFAFERFAQQLLLRDAGLQRRSERRVEELMRVAAAFLRTVHRDVGVFHQLVGVVAVVGVDRDPDRRRDELFVSVDGQRLIDRRDDPLRQRVESRRRRVAGDQHDELVAAHARYQAVAADHAGEPVADRAQQTIAERVAERVVDVLETIEVEKHHRDARVTVARTAELVAQALGEPGAIRQRGELVVVGQVFESRARAAAVDSRTDQCSHQLNEVAVAFGEGDLARPLRRERERTVARAGDFDRRADVRERGILTGFRGGEIAQAHQVLERERTVGRERQAGQLARYPHPDHRDRAVRLGVVDRARRHPQQPASGVDRRRDLVLGGRVRRRRDQIELAQPVVLFRHGALGLPDRAEVAEQQVDAGDLAAEEERDHRSEHRVLRSVGAQGVDFDAGRASRRRAVEHFARIAHVGVGDEFGNRSADE